MSSTRTCGSWPGTGDESPGVVQNWIWADENRDSASIAAGSSTSACAGRGVDAAWAGRSPRNRCAAWAAGMTDAMLGVDAENPTGALGLYEGLGFEVYQRSIAYGTARPAGPSPPARSAI